MINNGIFFGHNTHYIVDTDYDNYAVAYGCDQYWLFFYGEWATLLGREPFMEYPYVRKAKDFLDIIEYPYFTNWVKPGLECGFDTAKTLDEVMVEQFLELPDLSQYGGVEKSNNAQLRNLFYGGSSLPYGNLIDGL